MVPTQGELGWPDGGGGVRKDVVITAVAHGLPNVLDEAAEIKEAFGERAKLLQDCSVDALTRRFRTAPSGSLPVTARVFKTSAC